MTHFEHTTLSRTLTANHTYLGKVDLVRAASYRGEDVLELVDYADDFRAESQRLCHLCKQSGEEDEGREQGLCTLFLKGCGSTRSDRSRCLCHRSIAFSSAHSPDIQSVSKSYDEIRLE